MDYNWLECLHESIKEKYLYSKGQKFPATLGQAAKIKNL